jgi:hypothetical protein
LWGSGSSTQRQGLSGQSKVSNAHRAFSKEGNQASQRSQGEVLIRRTEIKADLESGGLTSDSTCLSLLILLASPGKRRVDGSHASDVLSIFVHAYYWNRLTTDDVGLEEAAQWLPRSRGEFLHSLSRIKI